MKSLKKVQLEVKTINKIALSVDCVIFGFDGSKLKVLLIKSDLENYLDRWSLLGDLLDPTEDIDDAAYRILKKRTGLKDVFLEQVQAFGKVSRHPGGRVVTIAYFSLINVKNHKLNITDNELHWHDLDAAVKLAFDHKEILETCYRTLQRRINEDPLVFSLLPVKFSMRDLQCLYESILNIKLDRRNFRKKFFAMDYLVDLDETEVGVKRRPGKLYRFDRKKYERMLTRKT